MFSFTDLLFAGGVLVSIMLEKSSSLRLEVIHWLLFTNLNPQWSPVQSKKKKKCWCKKKISSEEIMSSQCTSAFFSWSLSKFNVALLCHFPNNIQRGWLNALSDPFLHVITESEALTGQACINRTEDGHSVTGYKWSVSSWATAATVPLFISSAALMALYSEASLLGDLVAETVVYHKESCCIRQQPKFLYHPINAFTPDWESHV